MARRIDKKRRALLASACICFIAGAGVGWQAWARGASRDDAKPYELIYSQVRTSQAASESSRDHYLIESSGGVAIPAGTVERKGEYLICNAIQELNLPTGPTPTAVSPGQWRHYR